MSHIKLPEGTPGILALMAFRPETAKPLNELAEILLKGPSTLSDCERELIAAYVSTRNDSYFCQHIHAAVASSYLGGAEELVDRIRHGDWSEGVSERMKALLTIAGKVQVSGKSVLPEDVELARQHGATDLEIHDTVLLAAMFCMMNRYVEGLATWYPTGDDVYRDHGARLAQAGYINSSRYVPKGLTRTMR